MEAFKRCGVCGQLVDWDDLAEAVHHAKSPHPPMSSFTDDRAIQFELPLHWHDPAGFAAHLMVGAGGGPARDARKDRRKKSDFQ